VTGLGLDELTRHGGDGENEMSDMSGERRWELWGPLRPRYETPRPRKVLALDGGGIRGLITLPVLRRLEDLLRQRLGAGPQFRLCQYFDYIGGTSTGAIIAAALALGKMATPELLTFYRDFGHQVFAKRNLFERWKSLYMDGALQEQLLSVFGDTTDLSPRYLQCLLLVVTRNASTDSAWPISSNPFAKYNEPERENCNLRVRLWQLVRASTAAPVYFPPEVIAWGPSPDQKFVFVDGGTTPYNNPAFLMSRMATAPAFRLQWRAGERDLLVVSVGTGSAPVLGATADSPETNLAAAALQTLSVLMAQAKVDQDINCRTVGRCTYGAPLDRELGDLIPRRSDGTAVPLGEDLGRAFLYARYDVDLTREGLRALGLPDSIDPAAVAKLDSVDHMDELVAIGEKLAAKVNLEHLGPFVP